MAILSPGVLRDLQGGNKLKISVVFEQNSVNLSSEHCTAVMHQTAQQQVVHEITTIAIRQAL